MFQVLVLQLLVLIMLAITACNKVPKNDDRCVSSLVEHKIDKEVYWNDQYYINDQIQETINCILENELASESAVQLALLNNPQIQSAFEELGIAYADLVEAGLLSNPSFELEVRYPNHKFLKTNIEYLITSSILDIFLIPLRTKVAQTEFEQTKMKVANEILNLAFETRQTYYEIITEKEKLKYTSSIAKLIGINSEIISKQCAIGNIYKLDLEITQSHLLEAELEVTKSQTEIIRLKEKLNRLLGLCEGYCLKLPQSHLAESYPTYDIFLLESIALEERLDLQAARFEVIRLCQMLGLKEWWAYTNLNVGLAGERDPDGVNLLGPGLSGNIPIFNYGQAARLRLISQLRQARDQLFALEIQILSEVREAHKLLSTYSKILNDYQNHIIPMQKKILTSSEELYNVMGLGIDRLLEYKKQELIANQNYIDSVKSYLIARVQLDKALGGYLFRLIDNCDEGISK